MTTGHLNPPSIVLGGGGLHNKACWLIAYYHEEILVRDFLKEIFIKWENFSQQCRHQFRVVEGEEGHGGREGSWRGRRGRRVMEKPVIENNAKDLTTK